MAELLYLSISIFLLIVETDRMEGPFLGHWMGHSLRVNFRGIPKIQNSLQFHIRILKYAFNFKIHYTTPFCRAGRRPTIEYLYNYLLKI